MSRGEAEAYATGAVPVPDGRGVELVVDSLEEMCSGLGSPVDGMEMDDEADGVRDDLGGRVGDDFGDGLGGGVVGSVEVDEELMVGGPGAGPLWSGVGYGDDAEEAEVTGSEGGRFGRLDTGMAASDMVRRGGVRDVRVEEAVPEVAVGLDLDGDGKMDIEFPGAVAMPRSGNWDEEMERRRQSLWTAWSIAKMTQYRLMKHSELVAAMGWVGGD